MTRTLSPYTKDGKAVDAILPVVSTRPVQEFLTVWQEWLTYTDQTSGVVTYIMIADARTVPLSLYLVYSDEVAVDYPLGDQRVFQITGPGAGSASDSTTEAQLQELTATVESRNAQIEALVMRIEALESATSAPATGGAEWVEGVDWVEGVEWAGGETPLPDADEPATPDEPDAPIPDVDNPEVEDVEAPL